MPFINDHTLVVIIIELFSRDTLISINKKLASNFD